METHSCYLPCEKYAMKNQEVLLDLLHDKYCNWPGLVISKLVIVEVYVALSCHNLNIDYFSRN